MVRSIADRYVQQREHEAPVVIGHPRDNAPAYGWVESLRYQGGKLFATLKDVTEEFMEWWRKGMYKKRSISLYPDMTLRHVGWLGAMPPAIKGLEDYQFAEGGIILEFEEVAEEEPNAQMDEQQYQSLTDLLNAILEVVKKLQGPEGEEQTGSGEQTPGGGAEGGAFSEESATELAGLRAEVARLRSENELYQFNEFLDSAEMRQRIVPAMRPAVLDNLKLMASVGTFEFSDGTESALERYKAQLKTYPVLVEFGELAINGNAGPEQKGDEYRSAGESIANAFKRGE